MLKTLGGAQFSAFKSALVDLTVAKLSPIRAEMLRFNADPGHVDAVLARARSARARSRSPIMNAIKDILGLVR